MSEVYKCGRYLAIFSILVVAFPKIGYSTDFDTYASSGYSIYVPETSQLYAEHGCQYLSLLVEEKEIRSLENKYAPSMLLKKSGATNVFQCEAEDGSISEARGLRFFAHIEGANIVVARFDGRENLAFRSLIKGANNHVVPTIIGLPEAQPADLSLSAEVAEIIADPLVAEQTAQDLLPRARQKIQYMDVIRETSWGPSWNGVRHGRPYTGYTFDLTAADLDRGSDCNSTSRSYLATVMSPTTTESGDDCGHMLAQRLGGSGTVGAPNRTSIFSQNRTVNRGAFRLWEARIYELTRCATCGDTYVILDLFYGASRALRPASYNSLVSCDPDTAHCLREMREHFGVSTNFAERTFSNPYNPTRATVEGEVLLKLFGSEALGDTYRNYTGSGFSYLSSMEALEFTYDVPTKGRLFTLIRYATDKQTSVRISTEIVPSLEYVLPATTSGEWACLRLDVYRDEPGKQLIKLEVQEAVPALRIDNVSMTSSEHDVCTAENSIQSVAVH